MLSYFTSITNLKGIGEKTAKNYAKLCGGKKIIDILFHLPYSLIDRTSMPAIRDMKDGQIVTVIVKVIHHSFPDKKFNAKSPVKIKCENETGFLDLVFFHNYPEYLKKTLPINDVRVISGKVEKFGNEVKIVHPQFITTVKEFETFPKIEPVYHLVSGVSNKQFCKVVKSALQLANDLPEWVDEKHSFFKNKPSFKEALHMVHNPQLEKDLQANAPAKLRLAYDELLARQLSLQLFRKNNVRIVGNIIKGNSNLTEILKKSLPFQLTKGQIKTIKEIAEDQASDKKMYRLLQGDVGSGKTIVALFAMLKCVEENKQAVLMAPTEILAKQHFKSISDILKDMPIQISLLTGSMTVKQKRLALADLESGKTDIIIGTHALFQENVIFKNLVLAVIDEQHRFGVEQRKSLADKGDNVDILLMSATPIPRTLMLANYGDMDSSLLTEKPAGRKDITTKVVPTSKVASVIDAIKRVISNNNKIYWICPLVEESEVLDLIAVENRFNELKQIFGKNKVGLAHGKMKADERDAAMLEFKNGNIDLLVATTVIEVGVDVKDATIIIIENAERFGLSQLHQLRGRVGRNNLQSNCILIYKNLGKTSKKRLEVMRQSNDGFYLAEQDFKLRGGGEILGTRQSGLPNLKIANFHEHQQLLKLADEDAKNIVNNNPTFNNSNTKNLQILLKLFSHDINHIGI